MNQITRLKPGPDRLADDKPVDTYKRMGLGGGGGGGGGWEEGSRELNSGLLSVKTIAASEQNRK